MGGYGQEKTFPRDLRYYNMKTYSKNCIICNKEFTGVWKRKLCENQECKKQNVKNISKRIQQNRTLEERDKEASDQNKQRDLLVYQKTYI